MIKVHNAHMSYTEYGRCGEAVAPRADEPFELHGVVMRAQLLRMLKHRIGFCKPSLDAASLSAASALVPATQVTSAFLGSASMPVVFSQPIPAST